MKFTLVSLALTATAAAQNCPGGRFKIQQSNGVQSGNYWAGYGSTSASRTVGFTSNVGAASKFKLTLGQTGQLVIDDVAAPLWYSWATGDTAPKQLLPRETYPNGATSLDCSLFAGSLFCIQPITGYGRIGVCSTNPTILYVIHNFDSNPSAACGSGNMQILNPPSVACA